MPVWQLLILACTISHGGTIDVPTTPIVTNCHMIEIEHARRSDQQMTSEQCGDEIHYRAQAGWNRGTRIVTMMCDRKR